MSSATAFAAAGRHSCSDVAGIRSTSCPPTTSPRSPASRCGDRRIGDGVSVGGPQNLGFTEIALHLLARQGRSDEPRHVPLSALRAISVFAQPFRPGYARRAKAAVVMNTTEMAFDAGPVRDRFPDIPATSLADVTDAMTRVQES